VIESVELSLLARLHRNGNCFESKRTEALIERYRTAGWIVKGSRRHEWNLKEQAVGDVVRRLTVLLPTWQADFELLEKEGKSPLNQADLEALPALRRPVSRKDRINRRNWHAVSGAGPKRRQRRSSVDTLTTDWVLRLRPNRGLKVVFGDKEVDIYEDALRWTECIIPERAWTKISGFAGSLPEAVVTCENLGAFIDLPEVPNVTIVYAPGKDIGPATLLLNLLPSSRWVHFGDLDPEGVNIALSISRRTNRPLIFFVPTFVQEYLELELGHRIKEQWKDPLPNLPILKSLQEKRMGIYQERFMLDERLRDDLVNVCNGQI
jgi:hypothetical protein